MCNCSVKFKHGGKHERNSFFHRKQIIVTNMFHQQLQTAQNMNKYPPQSAKQYIHQKPVFFFFLKNKATLGFSPRECKLRGQLFILINTFVKKKKKLQFTMKYNYTLL